MTDLQWAEAQLDHALEQLSISDSLAERSYWGDRCDMLDALIESMNE